MSRHIYFIKPVGLPGPIKIGCSVHPLKRLMSITAWSPFPLELLARVPGDFALERNIHQCFADVHAHGEWFHPVSRLVKAIDAIKKGVDVAEAIDLAKRDATVNVTRRPRYWSPQFHQYMHYVLRLRAAGRRAGHMMSLPDDVEETIDRWSGDYKQPDWAPPADDVRRFMEVIDNPSAHCVPLHYLRAVSA